MTLAEVFSPESQFEYDHGDVAPVPYDELYDLKTSHAALLEEVQALRAEIASLKLSALNNRRDLQEERRRAEALVEALENLLIRNEANPGCYQDSEAWFRDIQEANKVLSAHRGKL